VVVVVFFVDLVSFMGGVSFRLAATDQFVLTKTAWLAHTMRVLPHPQGRKNAPMVTPKPKPMAAPATKPGAGAANTTSGLYAGTTIKAGIRTAGNDDRAAAAQIAVLFGFVALALNSVHDGVPVCQNCIAEVGSPAHVRRHGIQDGRKRQECLNAGIPGELVCRDGLRQGIASEVVMLVSPLGGVGNLVRKTGSGQDLRQKRIRIERNAVYQGVELARRIGRRASCASVCRQTAKLKRMAKQTEHNLCVIERSRVIWIDLSFPSVWRRRKKKSFGESMVKRAGRCCRDL
jgi:hypothetical protein